MNTRLKQIITDSEHSNYVFMFLGVFLLMSAFVPSSFLSSFNLQSMMFQLPEFGILALGHDGPLSSPGKSIYPSSPTPTSQGSLLR